MLDINSGTVGVFSIVAAWGKDGDSWVALISEQPQPNRINRTLPKGIGLLFKQHAVSADG